MTLKVCPERNQYVQNFILTRQFKQYHPPTFVYHPQSQVSGRVVCSFTTEKNIRKIKVRLVGKEHTEWRGTQSYYESSEQTTKTRTVTFEGDHEFIHYELFLKGPGTIPAGIHTYPFKFTLSQLLPGSLTHQFGNIRYYVELTIDRPWREDYRDKKVFKVFSPIDLQRIDGRLLELFHLSKEKTICCFWCASGPISVDVKLEKRAYAVGEKARMRIYCSNMSNINVDNVRVQIIMNFKFAVKRPEHDTKKYSEVIATWNASGVGAHGDRTYDVELYIPQGTVVPNFVFCNLFSKDCSLKINVVIEGAHSDIEFETPVALGHIASPNPVAPPWANEAAGSPFAYEIAANNTLLPPYPLDPPPSDNSQPNPMEGRSAMPMPVLTLPQTQAEPNEAPSESPKAIINGEGARGTSNSAPPSYDEAVGNLY